MYLFKDAFQLSGHSDANTFTDVTDWSAPGNYVKYTLTKATTGFADIAPMSADLGDGSGVAAGNRQATRTNNRSSSFQTGGSGESTVRGE